MGRLVDTSETVLKILRTVFEFGNFLFGLPTNVFYVVTVVLKIVIEFAILIVAIIAIKILAHCFGRFLTQTVCDYLDSISTDSLI